MTPASSRRALLGVVAVASCALAAHPSAPSRAHNGFGIAPIFSEPFGLVVLDGTEPLTLRWTAREAHDDQFYRFKAQRGDFPPTPSPPSRLRDGTLLTTLASDALSYALDLDLSALEPGPWRLFAEFDEPPFCVELESVPALVVLRPDPEAPPPFGLIVTEPLADSPIVDAEAPIVIEAIAPTPPRVTLEAGEIIRDPDFPELTLCVEFTWTPLFTVATDLPMAADPAAGPDRYRLDFTWDTRQIPDGAYLFRVTATDGSGETQVHWARRWINVEHEDGPTVPPIPDTGPTEPNPEASTPAEPNPEATAPPTPSTSGGCLAGPSWALPLLSLVALLLPLSRARARARGSRRRARRGRSPRRPSRSAA